MRSALMGAVLGLATLGAAAQSGPPASHEYPNKPIRWIVPFPPGGGLDTMSRIIGQRLTERWSHQVVIDFRPGAGGNVGTEIAARAAPDGYTVVVVAVTFTSYPSLSSRLTYDPVREFVPVTLLSTTALILVVHPSVPVKSVKELVALAKARPGELNHASTGIGTASDLTAELFKSVTRVKAVSVQYKGHTPALIDLVGGHIHMMFSNAPSGLPYVEAGKLRALAVTTLKRSALLPKLPTLAESGLPGFDSSAWFGLLAPAGTPQAIIGKLNGEVVRILKLPDVQLSLVKLGFEPVGNTPQEFAAYIRAEIAKWAKVIKASGIRAD